MDGAIKVAACAAIAVGGARIAQEFVEWEARKKRLSPKDKDLKLRSYIAGFALLGCSIGVKVSSQVLSNLSEQARAAQNDAWRKAQQQTGQVSWSAPDASGTSELADIQEAADGKSCGIRRDVIRSNHGEEKAHVRVCKAPGSRDFIPVVSVG